MPILQMGNLRLREGQNLTKAIKQTSSRQGVCVQNLLT